MTYYDTTYHCLDDPAETYLVIGMHAVVRTRRRVDEGAIGWYEDGAWACEIVSGEQVRAALADHDPYDAEGSERFLNHLRDDTLYEVSSYEL